jgi:CIC family chloride channel protein
MKKKEFSIADLLIWISIGPIAGTIGAGTVALFHKSLCIITKLALSLSPNFAFFLPIGGALVVGLLFIKFVPDAGGEGTQPYIKYINTKNTSLGITATLVKFPATVVALGTGCSGGIVGPLCRIGAGLNRYIAEKIFFHYRSKKKKYARIGAICGASGIVSSIFHSPLGGAIFAVEILRKDSLEYKNIFPSLISGVTASVISKNLFHQEAIFQIAAPTGSITSGDTLLLIPVTLVAGGLGLIFTLLYRWNLSFFGRIRRLQPLSAIAGGAVTGLLILMGLDLIYGTSMHLFDYLSGGNFSSILPLYTPGWKIAIFLLLLIMAKTLATTSTIGSGLSAGLTGPLIIIGILSGAAMSSLVQIPAGSVQYYTFLATGIAAMLGGVMNIPLAAIIITARMFGLTYLIPALLGSLFSYLVYQPQTVFEYLAASPSAISTDNTSTGNQK